MTTASLRNLTRHLPPHPHLTHLTHVTIPGRTPGDLVGTESCTSILRSVWTYCFMVTAISAMSQVGLPGVRERLVSATVALL